MKPQKIRIRWIMISLAALSLSLAGTAQGQSATQQAVVEKARSLESRGMLDLAAQTWQQVLLSEPDNREALAGLARIDKVQGKDAEAARLVAHLRQLDPKDPQIAQIESTVPAKVQVARQAQAGALAAAGNYTGAMEIYRKMYGLRPPDNVALEYYDTEAATEEGRDHAVAGLRELAKLHARDARYAVTLGRVLSYSPKTRAEGEGMLEQYPQDAAAQAALRQALLWDVENPAASGAIKRYLKDHPDQQLAQRLQDTETKQTPGPHAPAENPVERAAYASLQANQVDRAEQGFRSLLDKQPANPRALAGMGFVHMKQGKFDQAVSDFEAARHNGMKDPKIEGALDTAHFWLTMGEAAKAQGLGQLDLAIQRYRAALAQRAGSSEALSGLAGTLLQARQSTEAVQVYGHWVKVQPNSIPAWRGLFMAEVQDGHAQQALAVSGRFPSGVQSTLRADPEYLMSLAAAYRATGDEAKASETLEHALDLPFPDGGLQMTVALRLQYASVLAAANHQEQAAGIYRQVIAEQPNNAAAWRGLILAQHLMHDDAGAVESVEHLPSEVSDSVRRDADFLSLAAAAYQQDGRLEEAQRLLEEAAGELARGGTGNSADLELRMASIERQRNSPQRAVLLYRRVLGTDPERMEAWSGLLSALHESGDDPQAMAELAKMPARVQSELYANDEYLLTLSAIYAANGNIRWALATLSRLRSRYAAQHVSPPVDVEIQSSWLLLRAGEEGELYSTLMRLGGRSDLVDTQRLQIQTVWAAWSVRRAQQAAGRGDTRRALAILNTAKEALAGNDKVSIALAGGYLAAGDAQSALAIYQSVPLDSDADYQGAIGAALSAKNPKLAESWLRRALELYPLDPRMLGLAARFEQSRGDNGKALEYWKASLAISPRTGAADELARTLRVPVANSKARGALRSRDALAALLDPAATPDRRTIVLPGEAEKPLEAISEADSAPALTPPDSRRSIPSPAGGPPDKGGRLGDYRPPQSPTSRYDGLPLAGSSALPMQAAVTPSGAHPPDPPYVDPARGRSSYTGATGLPGSVSARSQAQASLDSEAPSADQRLADDEEALRRAGNQGASAPPTITGPVANRSTGLTVKYASVGQADARPSETKNGSAGNEGQQDSAPPGLTDQQLVDIHLPPLRGSYVAAPPSEALSARQEARQQIASIDGGLSPWTGGTGDVRHRSGTPGFDQLTALEAPFEASAPLGDAARLTVITTPVFLDAGVADGKSTLNFGSLVVGTIQPQQYADGVASELQLTTINFAARVGETPYGFLVTNITGGVRWRPAGGPLTFTFSREAVRDTQLSYSGLRDPGSATPTFDGNIWGGVVANGGDVQLAHGDALSGFYAGIGGQYITGNHVLTNTRFHGNAGAYWRVLTLPDLGTLVLGGNFFGMHYAHNQRYFSYGQGGYFSPEAFFLAAMPLSWTGHYGVNLHYNVTGSIGAQSFQEDSAPAFPLDSRLQSAFADPLVPVRASVGSNYDLQSEVAYRVEDHWYVGGFLDFNNTRDYESQSVGFFVRYLFRPQPDSVTGPIGAFPRDGFRPVLTP